jgi:hypothetical protein
MFTVAAPYDRPHPPDHHYSQLRSIPIPVILTAQIPCLLGFAILDDPSAGVQIYIAISASAAAGPGRTGRPVIAEALGPDLVEHAPVTLKIRHDDADPHNVGQRRADRPLPTSPTR